MNIGLVGLGIAGITRVYWDGKVFKWDRGIFERSKNFIERKAPGGQIKPLMIFYFSEYPTRFLLKGGRIFLYLMPF